MNAVTRYICGVCGGLVLLIGMQGHAEPPPAAAPSPSSQSTDMELIRTIIAHNTAARERIYSLPLRVELESETTYDHDPSMDPAPIPDPVPKGRRIDRTESVKIYDGSRFKTDMTRIVEVPEANYHTKQETSVVFNEEYLAEMFTLPKGRDGDYEVLIHVYEHRPNGEVLEETLKGLRGWKEPDVRKFGFAAGSSISPPDRLMELATPADAWSVDEIMYEEARLFRIKCTGAPDSKGKRNHSQYWIDPAKDFLIVRAEAVARDGYDRVNIDVELMELSEDMWFPHEIRVDHREFEGRSFRQHIWVSKAEANVRPPKDDFYIESLTFKPSSTRLIKCSPNGNVVEMLFYAGGWVPQELVPPEARPKPRLIRVEPGQQAP
ncbi:MAG: hypothetical protein AMXMBFR4_16990 [Candidatus Hydrogenedentota bacterium]